MQRKKNHWYGFYVSVFFFPSNQMQKKDGDDAARIPWSKGKKSDVRVWWAIFSLSFFEWSFDRKSIPSMLQLVLPTTWDIYFRKRYSMMNERENNSKRCSSFLLESLILHTKLEMSIQPIWLMMRISNGDGGSPRRCWNRARIDCWVCWTSFKAIAIWPKVKIVLCDTRDVCLNSTKKFN